MLIRVTFRISVVPFMYKPTLLIISHLRKFPETVMMSLLHATNVKIKMNGTETTLSRTVPTQHGSYVPRWPERGLWSSHYQSNPFYVSYTIQFNNIKSNLIPIPIIHFKTTITNKQTNENKNCFDRQVTASYEQLLVNEVTITYAIMFEHIKHNKRSFSNNIFFQPSYIAFRPDLSIA